MQSENDGDVRQTHCRLNIALEAKKMWGRAAIVYSDIESCKINLKLVLVAAYSIFLGALCTVTCWDPFPPKHKMPAIGEWYNAS